MIRIYIMREECLPEKAESARGSRFCFSGEEEPCIALAEEHWTRIERCSGIKEKRRRLMGCLLTACAFYDYKRNTGKKGGKITEQMLPAFDRQEAGKPYLREEPDFCFSISHSGSFAVCAVAAVPVGADIQERRPVSPGLAKRAFTEAERQALEAAGERREDFFFRLWSAKEAYIKYTGLGMRQGMQTFTAQPEQGLILEPEPGRSVSLTEIRLPGEADYWISICSEQREDILLRKLDSPVQICRVRQFGNHSV